VALLSLIVISVALALADFAVLFVVLEKNLFTKTNLWHTLIEGPKFIILIFGSELFSKKNRLSNDIKIASVASVVWKLWGWFGNYWG